MADQEQHDEQADGNVVDQDNDEAGNGLERHQQTRCDFILSQTGLALINKPDALARLLANKHPDASADARRNISIRLFASAFLDNNSVVTFQYNGIEHHLSPEKLTAFVVFHLHREGRISLSDREAGLERLALDAIRRQESAFPSPNPVSNLTFEVLEQILLPVVSIAGRWRLSEATRCKKPKNMTTKEKAEYNAHLDQAKKRMYATTTELITPGVMKKVKGRVKGWHKRFNTTPSNLQLAAAQSSTVLDSATTLAPAARTDEVVASHTNETGFHGSGPFNTTVSPTTATASTDLSGDTVPQSLSSSPPAPTPLFPDWSPPYPTPPTFSTTLYPSSSTAITTAQSSSTAPFPATPLTLSTIDFRDDDCFGPSTRPREVYTHGMLPSEPIGNEGNHTNDGVEDVSYSSIADFFQDDRDDGTLQEDALLKDLSHDQIFDVLQTERQRGHQDDDTGVPDSKRALLMDVASAIPSVWTSSPYTHTPGTFELKESRASLLIICLQTLCRQLLEWTGLLAYPVLKPVHPHQSIRFQ
eukprot:m.7842 g.7842  ORF g.7842 m.7842 type:complete len:530 (+) comp8952_c0_seq2:158-1747(+)